MTDAEIRDRWRALAHKLRDQRDALRELLKRVKCQLPDDNCYHDLIERALKATKQC